MLKGWGETFPAKAIFEPWKLQNFQFRYPSSQTHQGMIMARKYPKDLTFVSFWA
jgi:hypothetical protein